MSDIDADATLTTEQKKTLKDGLERDLKMRTNEIDSVTKPQ